MCSSGRKGTLHNQVLRTKPPKSADRSKMRLRPGSRQIPGLAALRQVPFVVRLPASAGRVRPLAGQGPFQGHVPHFRHVGFPCIVELHFRRHLASSCRPLRAADKIRLKDRCTEVWLLPLSVFCSASGAAEYISGKTHEKNNKGWLQVQVPNWLYAQGPATIQQPEAPHRQRS